MIEIKINNESLDMLPGQIAEIERNNPLISTDDIPGEFSFPLEIPITGKNMRLLNYINIPGKQGLPTQIKNVTWIDNGIPMYSGTLILESYKGRLDANEGSVSGYLTMGMSSFWQEIKDVNLRDLDWGGMDVYSQAQLKSLINGSLTGDSDTQNYVFPPIYDPEWDLDDEDVEWINPPYLSKIDTNHYKIQIAEDLESAGTFLYNNIVPMPYLIYVIKHLFEEINYRISGEVLSDSDFKKIILPNNYGLVIGNSFNRNNRHPSLTRGRAGIEWKNSLPNMSLSDFLTALKNRFNWGFLIDDKVRHFQIVNLSNVNQNSIRVSFDKRTNPQVSSSFQKEKKLYNLTQEYAMLDEALSPVDLSGLNYLGAFTSWASTPALHSVNNTDYIFFIPDNQFYVKGYDEDAQASIWYPRGDNIYDYTFEKATDEIKTNSSLLAMRHSVIGEISSQEIEVYLPYTLIPKGKEENKSKWISQRTGRRITGRGYFSANTTGLRLMFYQGIREITDPKTGKKIKVPATTNTNWYDEVKLGDWSLAYESDGEGLYEVFWANWKRILESNLRTTFLIYPKLHEYLNLQWDDIILIQNVPYFIEQMKVQSPYPGFLEIKALHIPS